MQVRLLLITIAHTICFIKTKIINEFSVFDKDKTGKLSKQSISRILSLGSNPVDEEEQLQFFKFMKMSAPEDELPVDELVNTFMSDV